MNYVDLVQRLEKIDIHLNDTQVNLFKQYFFLIQEWNERINLTAITSEEDIIEKHFFDSLLMAKVLPLDSQTLLDVGSGAGFPGIPLKIAFPNLQVTLLEPTNKRANFLNLAIEQLGLKKITVIADRAENLVKTKRESFDIVTARAVASLNILAELCIPLTKVNGFFLAMKGAKGLDELAASKTALSVLGCEVARIEEQALVTELDKRYNILIVKRKKTAPIYPRSFAQIKHRPL